MMAKRNAHNDEGTEVPIVQIPHRGGLNGAWIHKDRSAAPQSVPKSRKLHFGSLVQKVNMPVVSPRWVSVCWEPDR